MTAQPLPALASGDPSAWDQALYADSLELEMWPHGRQECHDSMGKNNLLGSRSSPGT